MAQWSLDKSHKFEVSAVEFGEAKEMAIFEILISSYLKDMH